MLKKIIKPVYAHCDIPCGIYETDTMRHASDTCLRMIEKIEALGDIDNPEKLNSFVRMVAIKEKHAQTVKDQASLLWSDYFKQEHLEKHPDLHTVFWQLAKQASIVKQTVSRQECHELSKRVKVIETIFKSSQS